MILRKGGLVDSENSSSPSSSSLFFSDDECIILCEGILLMKLNLNFSPLFL